MAQSQASGIKMSVHPDRLWIWDNHTYLDENRRTWIPIIIKVRQQRIALSGLGRPVRVRLRLPHSPGQPEMKRLRAGLSGCTGVLQARKRVGEGAGCSSGTRCRSRGQ